MLLDQLARGPSSRKSSESYRLRPGLLGYFHRRKFINFPVCASAINVSLVYQAPSFENDLIAVTSPKVIEVSYLGE